MARWGNGSVRCQWVKPCLSKAQNGRVLEFESLKDNRWNSSSVLFLSERTLARTIAGSGGLEPRRRNLHSTAPFASAMKSGVVDFRSRSSTIDDGKKRFQRQS